jgi:RNA polymerase sigma factor (sigma-70 family)
MEHGNNYGRGAVSERIAWEPELQVEHSDWRAFVKKLQAGDTEASEQFYWRFSRRMRPYLSRQIGAEDAEDKIHDAFIIVTEAIRHGELRDPECLTGYVLAVLRRQVAAHIRKIVQTRRSTDLLAATACHFSERRNPEQEAIARQNREVVNLVLGSIPSKEREILSRFYLSEQSPEQICSEMQLTPTQFRLLKSRAKSRFGKLGRRKFAHRPFHHIPLADSRRAGGASLARTPLRLERV